MVSAKQNHGRRAVARDVRPAGVDDMGQVHSRENCSMSFLPNSRFIKLFAVIWPVKPPWHSARSNRSLHERHGQGILSCGRLRDTGWRYASFSARSLGVMYGGLATTAW